MEVDLKVTSYRKVIEGGSPNIKQSLNKRHFVNSDYLLPPYPTGLLNDRGGKGRVVYAAKSQTMRAHPFLPCYWRGQLFSFCVMNVFRMFIGCCLVIKEKATLSVSPTIVFVALVYTVL